MSETENNPPPKPRSSESFWLVLAFLIAAGMFAAAYFLPTHGALLPMATTSIAPTGQAAELESRVHTLEDRVSALEGQIETRSETPATQEPSAHPNSSTDVAHVQSDLANLASTVGTLQDQVKQTGSANHALAQTALTKMVAYVQLHDAAVSDHGYTHELDTMRAAARDDATLKDPLDKLMPYAEKGAPNIPLLREQLAEQASATEVATAKASAQTWWERILAEFRGLVLIRSVNDANGQSSGLEPIKAALAQDDLTAALDAMKKLPPEAQQVLAGWRKQAEARLAINEALQAIADRLAAGGDTAPTAAPAAAPDKAAP